MLGPDLLELARGASCRIFAGTDVISCASWRRLPRLRRKAGAHCEFHAPETAASMGSRHSRRAKSKESTESAGTIQIVIETPKGKRNKFGCHEEQKDFALGWRPSLCF
jgi:hypothetical protein